MPAGRMDRKSRIAQRLLICFFALSITLAGCQVVTGKLGETQAEQDFYLPPTAVQQAAVAADPPRIRNGDLTRGSHRISSNAYAAMHEQPELHHRPDRARWDAGCGWQPG